MQTAAAPAVGSLATHGTQLSVAVELLLATALGLLLLGAGLAMAPPYVLPGPVSELMEGRRELVFSIVGAVILGVMGGLLVLAVS
jgi:hypothetical protein